MIDIRLIRNDPEKVKRAVRAKGHDPEIIEKVFSLDKETLVLRAEIERVRVERNRVSRRGSGAASEGRDIRKQLDILESHHRVLTSELINLLKGIPNLPLDFIPVAADERGNVVTRRVGDKPIFAFKPKEHWELGETLDIIDTKHAVKVAGSRFAYLKGPLALLQFALVQHTLNTLTSEIVIKDIISSSGICVVPTPFIPVVPPVFIRPEVMDRMARLEPRDDRYHTQTDDLYLIGSAEHTLGPLHMDETLTEAELPIRYVGYSTSFRREAGTYGKDTRGILRLHQFDKMEMESFTLPESSVAEQDFLVAVQEYLLQSLALPYQVVSICTGDMGGPDARQIDIETWMPGQGKYRETHTSDLMTDYQARRLNTRVKRGDGTSDYVHMNDATAFAVGRILVAILENYQEADGGVRVPEVLVPYCGFARINP